MAIEEVNQELWDLAEENVTKQQEKAWGGLFDEAVEEHRKDECKDCEEVLCARCEDHIVGSIVGWQEDQFDDQVEAEYDRLLEQQEEQETE
jgi:hypothetical protein